MSHQPRTPQERLNEIDGVITRAHQQYTESEQAALKQFDDVYWALVDEQCQLTRALNAEHALYCPCCATRLTYIPVKISYCEGPPELCEAGWHCKTCQTTWDEDVAARGTPPPATPRSESPQ